MALERGARPLAQCLRCTRHERTTTLPMRTFSTSTTRQDVETDQVPPAATSGKTLDPLTVSTPRLERKMIREQGKLPIGSRRRRRAIASSANIPFEQLPYQCFQEARALLQEDRNEKLELIARYRKRIDNLIDTVPVTDADKLRKEGRLRDMRTKLEATKILADINDPLVKKRFEDGQADMNKPIYRHLADKKWRSYQRAILLQRITQMNVIPDVLPLIDPIVKTELSFVAPAIPKRRRNVAHGEIIDSRVSEHPPVINIQKYDKGEKLVTIAVVNPDVPNVERDSFASRCHYLACNVPITPTRTTVELKSLTLDNQVVIPWIPAYAQKGLPYQRMSVVVLEQPASEKAAPGTGIVPPSMPLEISDVKGRVQAWIAKRGDFCLRTVVNHYRLSPIGVDLFRTEWDEGTAGVMQRAGIVGHDVEFKRKRVEPLPYQRLKEERYR